MNKEIDFTKVIKIIDEFKISTNLIAKELGIGQGTFSEKLNGKRYNKFTEPQKNQIVAYLKNLSSRINKL